MRWLILLHRYLGIAIGWLLVAWCLSGIVMMYVPYPELSAAERTRLLPELDVRDCCGIDPSVWDLDLPIDTAHIEMLAGGPVLRAADSFGRGFTIDLSNGRLVEGLTAAQARQAAESLAAGRGGRVPLRDLGEVVRDQWTVAAQFDRHRPLHRFALGDSEGTQWYLSSSTGQLVQATTRAERFWNWLGAVPHWLYPTLLRQNGPLWIQTVIWSAVAGSFLTALGLYLGVVRFRRRRSGRWSPYRAVALWHHLLGLGFGLLVLTWLFSGLLSVNPWGVLDAPGAAAERHRLRGIELTLGAAIGWAGALAHRDLPPGIVRLELEPFAGAMQVLSRERSGKSRRLLPATLEPAPLARADLHRAAERLAGGETIARADLLHRGDAYYFEHRSPRAFPVYRVILADGRDTRYYIDAATGRLLQKSAPEQRLHRWLFAGLHRIDFTPALRKRPLWDVLMIVLLAGATSVSATGTYMGIRSLMRRAQMRDRRAR